MTYLVQLVGRGADIVALEDEWTKLLLESPGSTVFASYQWNAAWWRHFAGDRKLYLLTVRAEAGALVGVAPFMLGRLGPFRRLQFIGTGLSDYGDLLAHPHSGRNVVAAVLNFLHARRDRWDLADLGEVPPASPLLKYLHLGMSGRARGIKASLVPQTPCPYINLPATWEEYVSGLPRKRRYYVSSFPRKFMREQSGQLEIVENGTEIENAVKSFLDLHMKRWADKPEEVSADHLDAAFTPFLCEVCSALAERGWMRVVSLRAGESTVASSLNFLLHNRWSAYMKGFDPAWSGARPGTVLDALRIKRAIEEGAETFDFGRGDEAYKSGYGLVHARNTRVLLGSSTPRSLLAYHLMMARIRYKDRRRRKDPEAVTVEEE